MSDHKTVFPLNPGLTRQTVKYLKRLTKTGVHGKTVGAVARTLIQDQIKQLIRDGVLRAEFVEDIDEPDEDKD